MGAVGGETSICAIINARLGVRELLPVGAMSFPGRCHWRTSAEATGLAKECIIVNQREASSSDRVRVRILGVGNLLMTDDGVGIHVVQRLREMELPSAIDVVDGGTGGMDLVHLLDGVEEVILVDAAEIGREPGEFAWLTSDHVPAPAAGRISAHQLGVAEMLRLAELMDKHVTVSICGVQPGAIDYGMELSPQVAGKLDSIVAAVVERALALVEG